jgi:large repetitive protein
VGGPTAKRLGRIGVALALLCAFAAVAVPGASAADFEGDNGPCRETPGDPALLRCPTGYVGAPYEVEIAVDEESGCFPYVRIEVVNSALPAGLSMTPSGVISGVPTSSGLTRFWLWNHDVTAAQGGPPWCAFDDVSEREFSIPIDPGFAIVTPAVKPGIVGQPYSETLTAKRLVSMNPPTGSDARAAWSVEQGALPPGLTLSADGLLAGTPAAEGSYQFVVRADIQNGTPPATGTYTLAVRQPVVVKSPFGSQQATGEVGIPFRKAFTATGGSGTYTWSLASSGTLPAGVALDAASGTISGTPHRAGNYPFVVTATDSEGRVATMSTSMRVVTRLVIKTARLKIPTSARVYRARLVALGGVQPLTWRVVRGRLPLGMVLSQRRGTLAGSPRQSGSFRVTVEVRDALGARSQKTLVLSVKS